MNERINPEVTGEVDETAKGEQEPVAWVLHRELFWPSEYEVISEAGDNAIPLYTAPVDAVNMSQECVDETAKGEHEPVAWHEPDSFGNVTTYKKWALENGWQPLYTAPPQPEYVTEVVAVHENGIRTVKQTPIQKREWVGLTKREFEECVDGLEDLEDCWVAIEAAIKQKNT